MWLCLKILNEDRKINLQEAVNMSSWTHNMNVNVHGFTPLQLVTGKSVIFPGILTGTVATDSLYRDELV